MTDRDARIGYVNCACEQLTGYAAAELVGGTPAVLKSGTHEADFYRELWASLLAGREFRAVFRNRRKDGALYYEEKIIRYRWPGRSPGSAKPTRTSAPAPAELLRRGQSCT